MGAVFLLASQSSPDMKVAVVLCVFTIAILSAFAEESSNESLLVRESRDAFPRREISRKKKNMSTRKKKKTKKGTSDKNQKAQENRKTRRQQKRKYEKKTKIGKKKNITEKTKIRNQKKRKSQRKNNKGKKRRMRKKSGRKTKSRKNLGRRTEPSKEGSNKERRFRQNKALTTDDVATFKKIRNFLSQKKRFESLVKVLQKKGNTTIFAEAAETLGKLTNNGTGGSEKANSAYIILKNCSTSVPKVCSSVNLTLNASKQCLQEFPTFETYMECQKNNSLNECGPVTIKEDCKKISKASQDANKRKKNCLSVSTVGSFAYCMNFIKSDLLGATASIVGDCPSSSTAPPNTTQVTKLTTETTASPVSTTTTSGTDSTSPSVSSPLTDIPLTSSPDTCPISGPARLYCDTEAKTTTANNYRNQAHGILTVYDVLSEKLDQLNVFVEYSILLGKLTENGTSGTTAAKNAYKFLSGCPYTAFVSCNNTEFADLIPIATQCLAEVNCTNTPAKCKLPTQRQEINKRRDTCLGTEDGSFASCMNFVKENVSSIICEDLPPSLPPIECKTVRTEGGEVITEDSSFNPNTKELTIRVPAHGSRDAATFIIGETKTCIVYPNECFVTDTTQSDLDLLNGAENTGDGCKDTPELTETDLTKTCTVNIDKGILSAEDIDQLPQSIQDACDGKTVRGSSSVDVDQETCNTNGTIENPGLPDCQPTTTRSPGCANTKV